MATFPFMGKLPEGRNCFCRNSLVPSIRLDKKALKDFSFSERIL